VPLTAAACLSQAPADRLALEEVLVLLKDMAREHGHTLTVAACLSEAPADRQALKELLMLLKDMEREAARGQYVNSASVMQVCSSASAKLC
jgi:hypothetical protein